MAKKTKKLCPMCHGKKIMSGFCQCSMEWRGTQLEDAWDECKCTPDETCPTCQGTGEVTSPEA